MRLFLAQSASLADEEGMQTAFSTCLKGRWRTAPSLHATLLFLGETFAPERIVDLLSSHSWILEDAPLAGVGLFERNRIFYAAGTHPSLLLARRQVMRKLEMPPETDPVVHVTLMRYKQIDFPCFSAQAQRLQGSRIGMMHGPMRLFRSRLSPGGAAYEVLHTFT